MPPAASFPCQGPPVSCPPAVPSPLPVVMDPLSPQLDTAVCPLPWMWHRATLADCGVPHGPECPPGEEGGSQAAVARANLDCCPALQMPSANTAILE